MTPHGKASLTLSDGERKLLLSAIPPEADAALDARLRSWLAGPGPVTVELPFDEWDVLAACLAFAADRVREPRVQTQLYALHDRVMGMRRAREGEGDDWPVTAVLPRWQSPGGNGGNGRTGLRGVRKVSETHEIVLWLNDLLQCQWGDPDGVLRLSEDLALADIEGVPFFYTSRLLLTAIHEMGGARLTTAGNLQRALVREMLERGHWHDDWVKDLLSTNKVINEEDVFELHVAKIVCRLAGLLRKYRGSMQVTRRGRELLPGPDAGRLYRALFITFFTRFSLAYLDGYPPLPLVQDAAAVSLFAMSSAGVEWRTEDELAAVMLLPPVHDMLAGTMHRGRASWLVSARLLRPLMWFGLVEEREVRAEGTSDRTSQYRKTDLFDRFISFHREG
jgi:hypothetical protein